MGTKFYPLQYIVISVCKGFTSKNNFAFLISFTLLSFISASGQNQSVVSSAGGSNKTNAISLDWTLGELATTSISVKDGFHTQGFHQPSIIRVMFPLSPIVQPSSEFRFTAAPVPVVSELNVTVDQKLAGKVSLQITDQSGRTVLSISPSLNRAFKFNMRSQPQGTYFLIIRDEKYSLLKSFSIIKVNQ